MRTNSTIYLFPLVTVVAKDLVSVGKIGVYKPHIHDEPAATDFPSVFRSAAMDMVD